MRRFRLEHSAAAQVVGLRCLTRALGARARVSVIGMSCAVNPVVVRVGTISTGNATRGD
jgi:hypothetical protein